MKKKVLRFLAVLLIFSICTSLLPVSVFAVPAEESGGEKTPTMVDFIPETETAEDIYGILDASIVPAAIDYNEAVEKNHIARCYEDEGTDLNKIIFLNSDGTKTMYTFDFPVKYVDGNGNIQDIRLEIADSTVNAGEFETAANDTVTTFSAQFTDGIALEGNDTEIRLIPILPPADLSMTMSTTNMAAPTATAQRIDANTVAYPYDSKTTVEYSLTYTGFKEDIVVSEYTGQTTYPFRLLTNGLALEKIDGSFFLVDAEGNIEASIGDIIIFTADERNNAFGDIEPNTIIENQEYLLNIVVDAEYLADPATVYPIRIDPTIEIKYSNNGAGAVEDITISTNTNFSGSYTSLYVGRRSTEGVARVLIRFPGLNLSGISSLAIESATLRVRDLMCEDDPLDVSCHIFTGNVWDGSSATWANSKPNSYVSTALSTRTLAWSIGDTFSSKHWYTFDVTSAVQGWINEPDTQNKGIIIKVAATVENGSVMKSRTFGSYNRASYKPSLTITYTDEGYGGGNSFATAKNFSRLSNSVITMVAGERRYYKFVPDTTGEYMFYSTDMTADLKGDPVVNLYDSNFQLIDDADDEAYDLNFRIAANLIAGRIYYFELGHYGENTGGYLVNITQDANLSGNYYFKNVGSLRYMDIHGPNAQEYVHQWSFSAGSQTKWTVVKQSDGYYTIRSLYGDKKYVGVSDIYTTTDDIVLFSDISDSCKWKIFKDYTGNLIIEPKISLGRVLLAPDNYVGTELALTTLTSNLEGRNFWREIKYKYDYTIAHYYDQGFSARFPEQVELLNTYHDLCSDVLLEVFGISTDRNIQSYTSCADNCVGTPVSEQKTLQSCNHIIPHKTRIVMVKDLGNQFGYGSNILTKCIWTGHLLEIRNSCSYDSPYYTIMMNLDGVTDDDNENSTTTSWVNRIRVNTLLHEASHQLGAPDHYCYDFTSDNCDNPNDDCWRCDHGLADEPQCIMSSEIYDIESMLQDGSIADIYCSQCKSSTHSKGIETHLQNHHS